MKNKHVTYILFYLFGIMHASSYTTSILFNFTLDYERGVFGLVLILLHYKYLNRNTIYFNVAILYIAIFLAMFSHDLTAHVSECMGFVLYYNIILIFWKILAIETKSMRERLIHFYTFLALPLLLYISPMLFNPSHITLDFYSDASLEKLGLKSRTVGWAAACSLPMVFEWTKKEGPSKFFSNILVILLLIVIIGSGSRSSIIGASVFSIIAVLRLNARHKIIWAFFLIILTGVILQNVEELSLSRRAELHQMGVSDDTYRLDLVNAFGQHIYDDFPTSFMPASLGEPNIQYALNKFFPTNGFGTHNSYITIILGMGIFSAILFFRFYKGLRFLVDSKMLYNFTPMIIISFTEDCFGPGQLLFMFMVAILVVTSK